MHAFLSADEVRMLTGYVHPKRQAAYLTELGIKFHRNKLGWVIVPRSSIDGNSREVEDAPFVLHKIG